jgi:hypothetical protein
LALRPGFDALDAGWSQSGGTATMTLAREPQPEAMARLVDSISTRLIQHVRDAAYYRWRLANPLCDYRFVFWSAAGLEGFLVLQLARTGAAADISIVDWEASRPDILEAMLSRVVAIGGYDRLSIWSATLPVHVAANLQRLGFTPVDDTRGDPAYRRGLLSIGSGESDIRATGPEDAEVFSSFERWDLRMLYSDFY